MSNAEHSKIVANRRPGSGMYALFLVAWMSALYASLSLANVRSSWSGILCGPWGCTAPLEAVISCHMSWLVALGPLIWWKNGMTSSRRWLVTAWLLLTLGLISVVAIALTVIADHHWQFTSGYLWHQIGLGIVGFIDFPALPCLVLGVGSLLIAKRLRSRTAADRTQKIEGT